MKLSKAYNEMIDEATLPNEASDKILEAILKENTIVQAQARLNEVRKPRFSWGYQVASVAAVLAIMVGIGLYMNRPSIAFQSIQLSQLPEDMITVRADEGIQVNLDDFCQQLGVDLTQLVPGYTCRQQSVQSAYDAPAKQAGQIASLDFENGEHTIRLSCSTFDTIVMAVLKRGEPETFDGQSIYFGYDSETAQHYAVWTRNDAHYLVSNDTLKEREFVDLAKRIAANSATLAEAAA